MSVFCSKVYTAVCQIPKGSVRTYAQIAAEIGHPRAVRAVGSCLRRNYDKSIPCHRVIRSDGTLGAYNRGGTPAKRAILAQEGWTEYNHVP
jgi:O-6-methylguanine DNA methyltransferase